MVDDYYRYQYPNVYDGRYNNYDAYLSDPYYYDPYRRNVSYQYAPAFIPGLNDLDYYGDWQNVSGYGTAGGRALMRTGFRIRRDTGPTIIRMGQPGFPASPGAMRLITMDVGSMAAISGSGFPMRGTARRDIRRHWWRLFRSMKRTRSAGCRWRRAILMRRVITIETGSLIT